MFTPIGTLRISSRNPWMSASLSRTKQQQKVTIKSTLHVPEIQRILEKEVGENAPAQRFVIETQRLKFPKSPGPTYDSISDVPES